MVSKSAHFCSNLNQKQQQQQTLHLNEHNSGFKIINTQRIFTVIILNDNDNYSLK